MQSLPRSLSMRGSTRAPCLSHKGNGKPGRHKAQSSPLGQALPREQTCGREMARPELGDTRPERKLVSLPRVKLSKAVQGMES